MKIMVRVKKFTGVYFRESATKKYKGRLDRCFYITYKDDKKKWEKIGWTSEGYSAQMANNIRAERIRAIRHGEELPSKKKKKTTLGDVWERYEQWMETGRKYPEDDRGYYKKHIEPRFKDHPLEKITPLDLESLKEDLTKSGLAPATVKHNLVIIRQLFNKAISWEMYNGENPIKKIKIPRLNNKRQRFFSKEEATDLLDALSKRSTKLHNMALMSLMTGMRAGEIFNLKWEHIDLENRIIHVLESRSGGARNVHINSDIVEMLEAYPSKKRGEYIFPDKSNKKSVQLSKTFGLVINKLGFNDGVEDRRDRLTFHSLRHTFASWLAIKGTPILTIKELLGHKTLTMTERYAHLIPDQKQAAVENIWTEFNGNGDADR